MLIFSQFYLPTKFIGGLQGNSWVWSKYVGSLLKTPREERKTEIGVRARRVGGQGQGAPGWEGPAPCGAPGPACGVGPGQGRGTRWPGPVAEQPPLGPAPSLHRRDS